MIRLSLVCLPVLLLFIVTMGQQGADAASFIPPNKNSLHRATLVSAAKPTRYIQSVSFGTVNQEGPRVKSNHPSSRQEAGKFSRDNNKKQENLYHDQVQARVFPVTAPSPRRKARS